MSLSLFLFKRVDEFNSGEEAHPLVVMFDRLNTSRPGGTQCGVPSKAFARFRHRLGLRLEAARGAFRS
jgi:hypothetical protein